MKSIAVALVAFVAPLSATAGSWPVRCELEKEKLTLAVEHYNPKKRGTEYDATPASVELWAGPEGDTVKLKAKKRQGPVWVYTFPAHTVIYTGVDDPDTEKHAVFLDAAGKWLGETVCK